MKNGQIQLERPMVFVPDEDDDLLLEEILEKLTRLIGQSKAKEIVDRVAAMANKGYFDKRFNIPNRFYVKYMIRFFFSEIVRHVEERELNASYIESFGRKFGLIFLDAEGLKAINFVLSQSKGDTYLELINSKAIPERNPALLEFLVKHDLEHFIASAGGDEIILIVYFRNWKTNGQFLDDFQSGNDHLNLLENTLELIQKSINEINLVKELGITSQSLRKKIRSEVPENFQWFACAPGGWTTFAPSKFEKYCRRTNNPRLMIFRIMDAIMTVAEKMAEREKKNHKKSLRGGDKNDKTIYQIITRNEEALALYKETCRLERGMEKLKGENASLKQKLRSCQKK